MSKERLEEIKKNVEIIYNKQESSYPFNRIPIITSVDVKLDYEDYCYLTEQAEKSDVLLEESENYCMNIKRLEYSNRKLRKENENLDNIASDAVDKERDLMLLNKSYLKLLELVIDNGQCSSIDFIINKLSELDVLEELEDEE